MKRIATALITLVTTFVALTAPAAAAGVTLQYGMTKDNNIRLLQRYLDCSTRGDFLGTDAYTSNFYTLSQTGLKNWQKAAGYPVTGTITVGSAQWTKLKSEATAARCVGKLDIDSRSIATSKQKGLAIDISKYDRKVRLLKNGVVVQAYDARFGDARGVDYFTREGVFSVYYKDKDHVSNEYAGANMPFSMFFSGGEAIHYSYDFDVYGYARASHGCVNIRNYDGAAKLFNATPTGTTVIVH